MTTIAQKIHRGAVTGTPVDTGRLRSNWQLSLDAPINYSIFPYAPGNNLGISETANANAAIEAAQPALAQFMIDRSQGKLHDIYIVNNVRYVVKLNTTTHSKQNAPGWLERAILRGIIQGGGHI